MQIIGAVEIQSEGVQKGVITSIEDTISVISSALEKIEQIIFKYHKIGLIIQSPSNSEFWGYYYNNLEDVQEDPISVIEEEKRKILKKAKTP